jgi:hypothetical protein
MNCLTDYIGLRGCGSSAPASGFYINDLPGISLKQMVSLTNEEEKTYLDLWSMIQTRAQSRFSLDVREAMGKLYRLKSLTNAINMGKVLQNSVSTSGLDFVGFTIELTDYTDYQYVPSPLNAIHVQELNFYGTAQASGQLFKIFDIDTNAELFSAFIDINVGWNNIQVNTTFNAQRLACVYFNTGDMPDFRDINLPMNHTTVGCCEVRMRGLENGNPEDFGSPNFTSTTYGLSGIFSVVCTWDNLICTNKSLFTRPYWYLCGIELLTEQLYSSKLNQFTTVNLQRAKELREEYQVEYMKALEQIAGGFNLSCDCCIECSGGVQLRETTSFY